MLNVALIRKALTEIQAFSKDPSFAYQVEQGKARLVRVVFAPNGKSTVLDICAWKEFPDFEDYMIELVAHARRQANK